MLKQLLLTIGDASIVRPDDIARSLGVSPRLLAPMLDDLVGRGYLQPIVKPCSAPCESCPIAAACSPAQSRLWTVTARGRALLENAHPVRESVQDQS